MVPPSLPPTSACHVQTHVTAHAFALSLLPTHLFFASLYYTDVGSLLAVVLVALLCLPPLGRKENRDAPRGPQSDPGAPAGGALRRRRPLGRPSQQPQQPPRRPAARSQGLALREWLAIFPPQRILALALVSATAVLYRQTNVVWVAFAVALGALRAISVLVPGSLA